MNALTKLRMKKLRQLVKKTDIYLWVNSFLLAAIAKRLDNFPIIEDFIPEEHEAHTES